MYACIHSVCLPIHGAPDECYYNTVLCCDYFSLSSLVSRAFSALCVHLKFGHHPQPIGYLCAKFRFFRGLRCWARPWRKIAYSITHPVHLMPRESQLALRNCHAFIAMSGAYIEVAALQCLSSHCMLKPHVGSGAVRIGPTPFPDRRS